MKRWAIATRWPDGEVVTFTVFEVGMISEVDPAGSTLARLFSSIEGFDLAGTMPDPGSERAAVSITEAVHGEVDVTGCSVVAYPLRGIGRYLHTTGTVISINPATERR